MGCHRNHAISHSPNQFFFEDTFVSNPGGPNEQFGTHEKLSCGVGGVQGNLSWMPGYLVLLFWYLVIRNIQLDYQLYNLCTRLWPTKWYKIILFHELFLILYTLFQRQ